ncbi:hypothetical protein LDENG_00013270 [Lucifuga dentata]|nr:hypothetical protein LDENG_00013270 [Lucifuga dentata]
MEGKLEDSERRARHDRGYAGRMDGGPGCLFPRTVEQQRMCGPVNMESEGQHGGNLKRLSYVSARSPRLYLRRFGDWWYSV